MVGAEPPTASRSLTAKVHCGCSPGPTGVMTHPGRAVDLQSASSCVACVDCIVWLLVRSEVVIVKHTPSAEARMSFVQAT